MLPYVSQNHIICIRGTGKRDRNTHTYVLYVQDESIWKYVLYRASRNTCTHHSTEWKCLHVLYRVETHVRTHIQYRMEAHVNNRGTYRCIYSGNMPMTWGQKYI